MGEIGILLYMDSLFHFVFSIIAGLAIIPRQKHKLNIVFMLAFSAVVIDIDHFFGFSARGTLHNIFITLFFPVALFLFFFHYENRWFNKSKKKSIKLQTYSLLLLVMLTGHIVADTFYHGGVKYFYPLSGKNYEMPSFELSVEKFVPQLSALTDYPWANVITRDGIALSLYAIIIFLGLFAEGFIYFFEQKHERFRKALKDVFTDIE